MAEKKSIVIKKIKKGGHGHHGGAWKVAYADFVTAMMAFFLLMWLLNATEAEQLAGLADYFAPTVGISGEMGIGFRGGKAAISDGIGADLNTNKGIVFGGVPTGPIIKVTETVEVETEISDEEKVIVMTGAEGESEDSNDNALSDAREALEDYVKGLDKDSGLNKAIDIVQTIEGLQIQIKDTEDDSMFETGTDEIKPRIKKVLDKISEVVQSLPNYVAVIGHANVMPPTEDSEYTIWELSTERANATRRYLIEKGVLPDRFNKMVGMADNEPLDPKHPDRPVNSRIEIVLLKDALLPHHKQVAPEGVFLDPDSKEAKELLGDGEKPVEAPPHTDQENMHNKRMQQTVDRALEGPSPEEGAGGAEPDEGEQSAH